MANRSTFKRGPRTKQQQELHRARERERMYREALADTARRIREFSGLLGSAQAQAGAGLGALGSGLSSGLQTGWPGLGSPNPYSLGLAPQDCVCEACGRKGGK